MQFAFRLFAEVEARFTSVERLLHYIRNVKPEGKFETTHQGKSWPVQGTIDFEAVSVCSFFWHSLLWCFRVSNPLPGDFCKKWSHILHFIYFVCLSSLVLFKYDFIGIVPVSYTHLTLPTKA